MDAPWDRKGNIVAAYQARNWRHQLTLGIGITLETHGNHNRLIMGSQWKLDGIPMDPQWNHNGVIGWLRHTPAAPRTGLTRLS